MRKLKLDIDTLSVQSFSTDMARETVGTVKGHAPPSFFACTAQYSCATHCEATTCPVQSIDRGCISDPTRCTGCQETAAICP
jgi:hypothetical protein